MDAQVINFLKSVSNEKSKQIEFNILTKTIKWSEIEDYNKKGKDIYFLANVKNPYRRNKDEDVVSKSYLVIDVDIRENFIKLQLKEEGKDLDKLSKEERERINKEYGQRITNEEIKDLGRFFIDALSEDDLLKQWSYIVYSGNGIHVYYIGDELKPDEEAYRLGVEYIQDRWNKLFNHELYFCDLAVKNIGRIIRLPGTINWKLKTKYGLEPVKAEIIAVRDEKCSWFKDLYKLGKEKQREEKIIQQAVESHIKQQNNFKIQIRKYDKRYNKQRIDYEGLYEAICQIPLNEIFANDFGVEYRDDPNNPLYGGFRDTKEKSRIGVRYIKGSNLLRHGGSSRWNWAKKGETFNTFVYIKRREKLNNKETFQWFLEHYPELQDKYIQKIEIKEEVDLGEFLEELDYKIPYTWGTTKIDNTFGKFDRGKLIVTVGESGSGKTEYTFFQARKNVEQGVKVLYLSLEMTKKNLISRYARKRAGITKEQWNTKDITDKQKEIFRKEIQRILDYEKKGLKIISIEDAQIDVLSSIIEEYAKQGYELFYIDNLGFIYVDEFKKEHEQVAEIVRKLKNLTNKLNITINLIHHFNKGTDKDRRRPRGLGSIRGSSKVEHDADYILRVRRELEDVESLSEEEKAEVRLTLLKDRDYGDAGLSVFVYFYKGDYFDEYPY